MAGLDDFVPMTEAPAGVDDHTFVHVVGSSVWAHHRPAAAEWPVHFVGMLEGRGVWAVDVPAGDDPADGAAVDLFGFYGRSSQAEWYMAGRAVQLVEWARTHRFCGRCAAATEPVPGQRAMRCPKCSLMAFPRLAPAMITLVTRGEGDSEEALLARGVQWAMPMFSCLAGFVEPGETLEGAVAREVREEVGVDVDHVTYHGSQPWPFPHSLMIGFRARWAGGDIVCDPSEIAEAAWFRRDALPQVPPRISIARTLIDAWLSTAHPPPD